MSTSPVPHCAHPAATADALLCVHASATTGRAWETPTAPLRDRYVLLTPDRLGYARDDRWPVGMPTSFDAEARHLEPLLRAHPRGVHLYGHSFGGAVALQMALRWPDRIRSLTLYEPTRFALLFGSPAGNEIVRLAQQVHAGVLSGRNAEAAARFVDYWSGDGTWPSMSPQRQLSITAHMPKVAAEFAAAFADATLLHAYRALTLPVRVLLGGRSPQPTREICARLATLLPNCTIHTLETAGHMGALTHAAQAFRHLSASADTAHCAIAA